MLWNVVLIIVEKNIYLSFIEEDLIENVYIKFFFFWFDIKIFFNDNKEL